MKKYSSEKNSYNHQNVYLNFPDHFFIGRKMYITRTMILTEDIKTTAIS